MPDLKHSYSSLKMFDQCPKKYYHLRIARDVQDKGSEASIYGERVHKSFEDRLRDGVALPDDLKKHESKCVAIEALGGTLTPEKELCLTKDFVAAGWWDEDVYLRSKLDVFVEKDDKAVILDWKTGKRKPDFFQLELSAMQTFMQYPRVDDIRTGFVWLRDDIIDQRKFVREDTEDMVDRFQEKVERVDEANSLGVWQAKPGPLCEWCPAKDICEFAERRRR